MLMVGVDCVHCITKQSDNEITGLALQVTKMERRRRGSLQSAERRSFGGIQKMFCWTRTVMKTEFSENRHA